MAAMGMPAVFGTASGDTGSTMFISRRWAISATDAADALFGLLDALMRTCPMAFKRCLRTGHAGYRRRAWMTDGDMISRAARMPPPSY